jgi:ubiquinone biosynthesis protein
LHSPQGHALALQTPEARIRLALAELGPTFVKLGQMLSTRPDLVGPALAAELTRLQHDVPADPFDTVRRIVESELRKPLDELFAGFDPVPLASASIGQVHDATLPGGGRVVVKVQHAGIEATVRTDLDILGGLAELAEEYLPEFRPYRPRTTVAEFQRTMLRELDFNRERRNLEQFTAYFRKNPNVVFPQPVPALCTARVLTMERLDGVKLSDAASLAGDLDREAFARRGAGVFVEMIFRDGFYHADPHPGNLMVLPGGRLGVLDCGMVGQLDDTLREGLEDILLAVVGRDAEALTAVLTRLGTLPPDLDETGLRSDVTEYLGYYAALPLDRLDLGGALTELVDIIRRYRVLLPGPLAMLLKVLIMLEGTSRLLSPQFNLTELIRPYQEQMIRRRLSPRRQWRKLRRSMGEWSNLAEVVPRAVRTLLLQAQSGRLEVRLEHRELDSAVNRLVLGLLASALLMGGSVLMGMKTEPTYAGMSISGVLVFAAGAGLAGRIVWLMPWRNGRG